MSHPDADSSYPPIYHEPSSPIYPEPSSDQYGSFQAAQEEDIPVFDLERGLDSRCVGKACREWGVFRLVNHGIPAALSERVKEEARKVLSLPFETKQTMVGSPVVYFWGTPLVTHLVKNLYWFDSLQVAVGGKEDEGGSVSFSEDFRCLAHEYCCHMVRIARVIFDAVAVDLKIDSGLSTSYLRGSDCIFRAYRYLCSPSTYNNIGFHAHTDSSTLSILSQDEVGGLQVLHGENWLDVAPVPDTLIINLGDMMQAISGDEYKSVEHRVLVRPTKERISLCYFAFPSDEGVIVNSKYRAFTYKDFKSHVKGDVEAFGYKVGLKRFRINDS